MRNLRERAVFVDTSAFYAFVDEADQWHPDARRGFDILGRQAPPLFTTNLIVAETHALLSRHRGSGFAREWFATLASINLVFEEEDHHRRVQNLLRRYNPPRFSYADALSFVVMEELGLRTAFSFDRHFQDYGWTAFPPPSA